MFLLPFHSSLLTVSARIMRVENFQNRTSKRHMMVRETFDCTKATAIKKMLSFVYSFHRLYSLRSIDDDHRSNRFILQFYVLEFLGLHNRSHPKIAIYNL